MRLGAWKVDDRVRDMDADGVWASVLFPSMAFGFAGQHNPMQSRERVMAGGVHQRLHAFRVFHEDRFGVAGSYILGLIRKRICSVEGRGNGAIGENAEIGEIKFGASLGMKRYRVAFPDT